MSEKPFSESERPARILARGDLIITEDEDGHPAAYFTDNWRTPSETVCVRAAQRGLPNLMRGLGIEIESMLSDDEAGERVTARVVKS